jgi:hypothetical protein
MLIVETIAKIRRAYFVQKRSIKAICRELGVSRKVVRKVLRSDATEFKYERGSQPAPKIGPWRHQLDALLLANDSKVARERLTLIRVFEELRALGYDGSYDAVRRYTKAWQKDRGAVTSEAYVPQTFAPGEAYQFDWSHEIVLINGTTVTVKVAHVRLSRKNVRENYVLRDGVTWKLEAAAAIPDAIDSHSRIIECSTEVYSQHGVASLVISRGDVIREITVSAKNVGYASRHIG